jgi:hypothetical protein
MTRRSDDARDARLPDLLTVEEAARLIRVGRTKAYAMAQEWRATGGRSGLPVVDFGHVLRVPRRALEELIGAELTGPLQSEPQALSGCTEPPTPSPVIPPTDAPDRAPRRRRPQRPAQPALFDPPPAS